MIITEFLSDDSKNGVGALAAIVMWMYSNELPSVFVALIAKTYAPVFVGVPESTPVAALKANPSGRARVSNALAQLTAVDEQAGIEVESVFSS